MQCSNCRFRLSAIDQPCPQCGHQNEIPLNWTPSAQTDTDPYDKPDLAFAVIGFAIPFLGLILFFGNSARSPLKAKSALKGTCWGFGTAAVFALLVVGSLTMLGKAVKKQSAYLEQSSSFTTGNDVQFASDVVKGLADGDAAVGDYIDFDHFRVNQQDVGALYRAQTTATGQASFRRSYIEGFSSREQQTPINWNLFTNWHVQSSNAGGCVVGTDGTTGSLYITLAYQQGHRKLYAIDVQPRAQ